MRKRRGFLLMKPFQYEKSNQARITDFAWHSKFTPNKKSWFIQSYEDLGIARDHSKSVQLGVIWCTLLSSTHKAALGKAISVRGFVEAVASGEPHTRSSKLYFSLVMLVVVWQRRRSPLQRCSGLVPCSCCSIL